MSSSERHAEIDPQDLSLRQLVSWLATPARCGIFLSAHDLARIGREIGAGIAPFSRQAAIQQLISAASLDDTVDELFTHIHAEFEHHLARYRSLNTPTMTPWITLAEQGLATWSQIEEAWRDYSLDLEG